MSWSEAALWWLPTLAVAVMTGLGLTAAARLEPEQGKRHWTRVILAAGALWLILSIWQQNIGQRALTREGGRLHELWSRLDEVGRMLPAGPGTTPSETFDTVSTAIVSLNGKIKDLETQIQALQEKSRGRTISDDTAGKMAEYLRPLGNHRVVVSCPPDDTEAFKYANQIANILRAAGWDALGPETTTIFGETSAMGITLYVRAGIAAPDTVKLLLDAFARFNIPFQSGVAPSAAIPDPATVEMFVGQKP
ncbi:MAG TPA: hypothetical protein VHY35_20390 [Stellaceae bacterium]|jgi:hypothetical protein|nr:hypothetical protein [Stellaceae bacterium]